MQAYFGTFLCRNGSPEYSLCLNEPVYDQKKKGGGGGLCPWRHFSKKRTSIYT